MAIKKWWGKLFHKEKEPKEEVLKDLSAIMEALNDLNVDLKALLPELHKLEDLERERQIASASLTPINLETQAELLDKILIKYEFLQNDVDVNGIRMKRVAKEFLHQAKEAGLNELVKQKQKDPRWNFNW